MSNNPYPSTASDFSDPDVMVAWAIYEAQARRAHRQYLASPTATYGKVYFDRCYGCGRPTGAEYGVCSHCSQGWA